ncbi:C69 family dipeptidase [Lactobacillus delbrueckii]|uniref:C69 family dipeptidase n=1 Tax=Lactobacillus delbrueckii TaxID=1584 RepID=UPI002F360A71
MVPEIKLAGYVKSTVNYSKAFGANDKTDAIYNRPRMWDGQRILTPSKKQSITKKSYTLFLKPDKKVSPAKVGQVLSSHFTGTKYSSYGKWKGGYRPINVPTDVESHILQIRNNVPKEYAAIQWLAMARRLTASACLSTPTSVTRQARTRLIPSPPTGLTKPRPW